MKLFLWVKPGAKLDLVTKIDETHFKVNVKAPPSEGKANAAVVKVMACYLGVPQSRLEIMRGLQGKQKVLKIH